MKRMRVRCIKGSHEFTGLYHPEELMSLFEADYEFGFEDEIDEYRYEQALKEYRGY